MDDESREVLQRVVGDEAGLPPTVHKRLRGDDVGALRADARVMRSELGLPPLDEQQRDTSGRFTGSMNDRIRLAAGR